MYRLTLLMTSQEVRGHGEEAVVEHCGGEQKW